MWIRREVWERLQQDLTHRVQTDAGMSNRIEALTIALNAFIKRFDEQTAGASPIVDALAQRATTQVVAALTRELEVFSSDVRMAAKPPAKRRRR